MIVGSESEVKGNHAQTPCSLLYCTTLLHVTKILNLTMSHQLNVKDMERMIDQTSLLLTAGTLHSIYSPNIIAVRMQTQNRPTSSKKLNENAMLCIDTSQKERTSDCKPPHSRMLQPLGPAPPPPGLILFSSPPPGAPSRPLFIPALPGPEGPPRPPPRPLPIALPPPLGNPPD